MIEKSNVWLNTGGEESVKRCVKIIITGYDLGGHESPGMADLPHDLPLHTGFVGCMSSVQLKAGHVTVPLSLSRAYSTVNTGRSVSQCSTNECYRNNICQHNGACIQHGSSLA